MSREENLAKVEADLGNFAECLVGGSPEEQARRRKIKRRALVISVALQSLGLAALVIAPLLAKPAEITMISAMPIPPYSHNTAQRHTQPERTPHRPTPPISTLFQPPNIPTNIATQDRNAPNEPIGPEVPIGDVGPGTKGLLDVFDTRVGPVKPEPPPERKRLVVGHIDPALLIHRVEPVFPALARQIRRSGKVELHAIIATDGSIQSLEAVSGDPLFIESAKQAVLQWRYKPTYLNGLPVEIDTLITVIYTVSQP